MCEEPEEVESSEDEDYEDDENDDDHDSDSETEDENQETREWIEEERRRRMNRLMEDRSFTLMRNLFRDQDEEDEENTNANEIQEIGGDDFSSISLESEDEGDEENSNSESEQSDMPLGDFSRERPTTDHITEKLLQRGITMQHLVKLVLSSEFPMYHDIMSRRNFRRDTQNLHANIIDIIEIYAEAQYQQQQQEEEEENEQTVVVIELD
jgi:hypothetical protein